MSIESKIAAMLQGGMASEFRDAGPYLRLTNRRVLLANAARVWVDPRVAGGTTMLPLGDPGIREGLQRILGDQQIQCGERLDRLCPKTGKRVLMKRLEPYSSTRAEVWELRSFDPAVRLFGFFLGKGDIVFTHGSNKDFSKSDNQYEEQMKFCETIRTYLGFDDADVCQFPSVHDYF